MSFQLPTKVLRFNVQFKADTCESNEKKLKRKKQNKKTDDLIKSRSGSKNSRDPSEKVRETMVGRIYGKGKF